MMQEANNRMMQSPVKSREQKQPEVQPRNARNTQTKETKAKETKGYAR